MHCPVVVSLQMLKLADNIVRTPTAATQEQIASLDVLMKEAYKEIDKAVKVGHSSSRGSRQGKGGQQGVQRSTR
jgi:hypothetical protein